LQIETKDNIELIIPLYIQAFEICKKKFLQQSVLDLSGWNAQNVFSLHYNDNLNQTREESPRELSIDEQIHLIDNTWKFIDKKFSFKKCPNCSQISDIIYTQTTNTLKTCMICFEDIIIHQCHYEYKCGHSMCIQCTTDLCVIINHY